MYFETCPIHNHTHVPQAPAQPFRFLDLPPEIRNRIASLVLSSPTKIRIRHARYNRHPPPALEPKFLTSPRLDFPLPRTPPATSPCEAIDPTQALTELQSRARDGHSRLALLMACRRTYTDHWATYYQDNEFSFTPETWLSFRKNVPEKCLDEIRYLYLRMPYRSRQMHVWRSLAELKSLERITVLLAPVELASKLERASCVAGARMCKALRELKIKRDALVSTNELGEDHATDRVQEEKEKKEDEIVVKCVNKMLEERWRGEQVRERARSQRRLGAEASAVRKATSRAGSEARQEKRAKRRMELDTSPTPDERAMDEYFRMVESTEGEDVEASEA